LDALLAAWALKFEVSTVLERIVGPGPSVCEVLVKQGNRVTVARDDARPSGDLFDLVVVQGPGRPAAEDRWRNWLVGIAKHASKLLVVETPNLRPSLLDRLVGGSKRETSWGSTEALAPVLWEIGRVREHASLDAAAREPAARHAFVVDVTPRTPQARRKLRLGMA
jgi:hypothetical protein